MSEIVDGMGVAFEIWVDARERPRKCTVTPLAGRADVSIARFEPGQAIPVASAWLLHPDGEPLDRFARGPEGRACTRLAVLDTTWKRVPDLVARIAAPVPPRRLAIPAGFVTVYPRRNQKGLDPAAGLASVEAIFLAAAFLGNYDESFLAHYHWRAEFLALNAARLEPLRSPAAVSASPSATPTGSPGRS